MPKRIALALTALSLAASAFVPTAFAVDPAIKKQLEKLDPATRLEQSCDTELMSRINKDDTGYKPDKVIAYTFKDPIPGDDRLEAPAPCSAARATGITCPTTASPARSTSMCAN